MNNLVLNQGNKFLPVIHTKANIFNVICATIHHLNCPVLITSNPNKIPIKVKQKITEGSV